MAPTTTELINTERTDLFSLLPTELLEMMHFFLNEPNVSRKFLHRMRDLGFYGYEVFPKTKLGDRGVNMTVVFRLEYSKHLQNLLNRLPNVQLCPADDYCHDLLIPTVDEKGNLQFGADIPSYVDPTKIPVTIFDNNIYIPTFVGIPDPAWNYLKGQQEGTEPLHPLDAFCWK